MRSTVERIERVSKRATPRVMISREQPYVGALTIEEAREGALKAWDNAKRLLLDADALAAQRRHPSAIGLALSAMEESAKGQILVAVASARTEEGRARRWADFRDHKAKIATAMAPLGDAASHVRGRQEALRFFRSRPRSWAELREATFYVDCLVGPSGEPMWATPSVVTAKTCRQMLEAAHLFVRTFPMPPEEMALWIEHVLPHVETSSEAFRSAVLRFEEACIAAGLRNVTMPLRVPQR